MGDGDRCHPALWALVGVTDLGDELVVRDQDVVVVDSAQRCVEPMKADLIQIVLALAAGALGYLHSSVEATVCLVGALIIWALKEKKA